VILERLEFKQQLSLQDCIVQAKFGKLFQQKWFKFTDRRNIWRCY